MQCITQRQRSKKGNHVYIYYMCRRIVYVLVEHLRSKSLTLIGSSASLCCYMEDLNMSVMSCYCSDMSISAIRHCFWVLGVWFTVAIQFIPKVFSGVQVWILWWPVHRLTKSFLYGSCFVHTAIIVLGQKKPFPNCCSVVGGTQFFRMQRVSSPKN